MRRYLWLTLFIATAGLLVLEVIMCARGFPAPPRSWFSILMDDTAWVLITGGYWRLLVAERTPQ